MKVDKAFFVWLYLAALQRLSDDDHLVEAEEDPEEVADEEGEHDGHEDGGQVVLLVPAGAEATNGSLEAAKRQVLNSISMPQGRGELSPQGDCLTYYSPLGVTTPNV
jgi:hypothetical protein